MATKKFIIKNLEKEKRENKNNIFDNSEEKQKKINFNKNGNNNKLETNIKNNNVSRNKKPNTTGTNKVYDITFDEIKEDINIRNPQDKNSNREKEKIIMTVNKDLEIKNGKNIDLFKRNEPKKNDNRKNKEILKTISIIKKENAISQNYEQTKNVKPISSVLIDKENFKKDKYPENNNKVNRKNIIEKNIKKDEKYKENNIQDKNIATKKQIDFNFIKKITKRYQESPPQEIIRSKSQIFSQNNKNSSSFIFNKIISSIERIYEIVTKNITNPIYKQVDIGIHFKPNDFKYLGVIGKGEYGKIYLVQWKTNDNQFYAMKYEKFNDFEEVQKNQDITRKIKDFISKTKSEGVIKIYGDVCLKIKNIYHYYTLMEKSERDVEQECIIRNKYLKYYTEKNLIDILCQLILTCANLQKNGICHGDIKPQNILILNGVYKLSDFGEVKIIEPDGLIEQDIGGTELYMSPKLFFAMKKNEKSVIHNAFKSDVFSLALCMLLMATFNYDCLVQIRELTDMEKLKMIVTGFLSKRFSINFIAFLLLMLEIDEDKRPDFVELEGKLVRKNQ